MQQERGVHFRENVSVINEHLDGTYEGYSYSSSVAMNSTNGSDHSDDNDEIAVANCRANERPIPY